MLKATGEEEAKVLVRLDPLPPLFRSIKLGSRQEPLEDGGVGWAWRGLLCATQTRAEMGKNCCLRPSSVSCEPTTLSLSDLNQCGTPMVAHCRSSVPGPAVLRQRLPGSRGWEPACCPTHYCCLAWAVFSLGLFVLGRGSNCGQALWVKQPPCPTSLMGNSF